MNIKYMSKMKTLFFTLVFTLGILPALTAQKNSLIIGEKAPKISAVADDGTTWDINDYLGKKNIVVYFYPAAMTGGCTAQACAYRDFSADLGAVDAMVVGISGDNVEGLKLFKKAHDLNFTLLSDEGGEIAAKFGVPTREGGTISREIEGETFELFRGITTSRWTFIIDKNGKVVYKNEEVNASEDSKEVINYLKNNS